MPLILTGSRWTERGEARRGADDAARAVGLPQPVAILFLELAQQQADGLVALGQRRSRWRGSRPAPCSAGSSRSSAARRTAPSPRPAAGCRAASASSAIAVPRMPRKLSVASGSAAIATARRGHHHRQQDPQPHRGADIGARRPARAAGPTRPRRARRPSSTVSRTSRSVAVLASRWRVARRRIATATPTTPVDHAPADQHRARRMAVEQHHDQRGADQIGGEQEQGELAPGMQLRRADRPPIGRVRRIVQPKQRADIDPRLGKLRRRLRAHASANSAERVSEG